MRKIALSWSGGKDSCLALKELLEDESLRVAGLLTTIIEESGEVSAHRIPKELVELQAASLGLSLDFTPMSARPSNAEYEEVMIETFARYRRDGIDSIAYADLFLDDIRRYREELLMRAGLRGLFPLWGRNTRDLVDDFLDAGFKAVVVSVDLDRLPAELAGRQFDRRFIRRLPPGVDPCGENGEFHTFVHDGPIFKTAIPYRLGGERTEGNQCFRGIRAG